MALSLLRSLSDATRCWLFGLGLTSVCCLTILADLLPAQDLRNDELPRAVDERLRIDLFAESPQIRTPTGLDVDDSGRVWAIESNTHFRPEGYDGHPSDRLLIFQDRTGNGRGDYVVTFADGFEHAMSVAVRPSWLPIVKLLPTPGAAVQAPAPLGDPQQVYVATRREILLLEDTTGDNQADQQTRLAWLETAGNYPHNGLAGFAFDAEGWLYFGFGENLGAAYTIHGRDGAHYSGGGEGGNMYRMRPDGSGLTPWATGFWNPHASCVDAFGNLFTVDNDPDSRPPCRLIHVVKGGDYGYRFSNGRAGLHPFTAWNGEVPGTLPMIAGTGEAPSGVLAYEHQQFPEDYRGTLLVTSWGDHRIDRFRLKPKGASFESVLEPVIRGGENFRPVGIALAPDGSIYLTDWVLRDYKLHGQGRIWRISAATTTPAEAKSTPDSIIFDHERLESPVLAIRRQAATRMAGNAISLQDLQEIARQAHSSPRARYEAATALIRTANTGDPEERLPLTGSADLTFLVQQVLRDTPGQPDRSVLDQLRRLEQDLLATPAQPPANAMELLRSILVANDPFLDHALLSSSAAATLLPVPQADWTTPQALIEQWESRELAERLTTLSLLAARQATPDNTAAVEIGLQVPFARSRQVAVQWAAEERLTSLRSAVAQVLTDEPMTPELLLATLAALDMLDGNSPREFDRSPPKKYLLPLLEQAATSDVVKLYGLKLISPQDSELRSELLDSLTDSPSPQLRQEALRSLWMSGRPEAFELLLKRFDQKVADLPEEFADPSQLAQLDELLELLLGLSARADQPAVQERFLALLAEINTGKQLPTQLPAEIVRGLRSVALQNEELRSHLLSTIFSRVDWIHSLDTQLQMSLLVASDRDAAEAAPGPDSIHWRPKSLSDWQQGMARLPENASDLSSTVKTGERIFFHPQGAGCYKCHTIDGRGGKIGPDLSTIGAALSREKLLDSILNPSAEVAPQFTNWNLLTTTGQVHSGMIVYEDRGETTIGKGDGSLVTLKTIDIEHRVPLTTSVMPEKLADQLTLIEMHALLNFLQSLR